MTLADHTLALCKTCRRAIYCWYDHPLFPVRPPTINADQSVTHHYVVGEPWWTHFVADPSHDAVPLPGVGAGVGRVLVCADCHQPQKQHADGWHCANPHCSGLDKD